jgi:hypothetical protein
LRPSLYAVFDDVVALAVGAFEHESGYITAPVPLPKKLAPRLIAVQHRGYFPIPSMVPLIMKQETHHGYRS